MDKKERNTFIREMKKIGDAWTEEQVEDVYGNCSLQEALADRKAILGMFFRGITEILNN